MVKDIVVNLVTKDDSIVGIYAVSVAAALQAHLTGVAFIYDPVVPIPTAATFRPTSLKFSGPTTKPPPKPPLRASPPRPTAPEFPPNR